MQGTEIFASERSIRRFKEREEIFNEVVELLAASLEKNSFYVAKGYYKVDNFLSGLMIRTLKYENISVQLFLADAVKYQASKGYQPNWFRISRYDFSGISRVADATPGYRCFELLLDVYEMVDHSSRIGRAIEDQAEGEGCYKKLYVKVFLQNGIPALDIHFSNECSFI